MSSISNNNTDDDETIEQQVLELKRQALVLKQQGDTNNALQLLGQARDLEFSSKKVEDLEDPTDLKKLAVVLKKKGDIEGAKHALLKAKQVVAVAHNSSSEETSPPPQQNVQKVQEETSRTDKEEEEEAEGADNDSNLDFDNVSDANEDDLKELQENDTSSDICSDDDIDNLGDDDEPITFTVDEMIDLEMMMEFQGGGLPVPSAEEYNATILEQKKKALAFKQSGNTAKALDMLKIVKRLQATKEGLAQTDEGLGLKVNDDDDQWLEELGYVDSEEVGNFLNPDTTTLNLEDLDGMDPSMLQDALDMGMEIPSIEDIMTKSKEKKMVALECKQRQDIEGAKAALIESKKFQLQADKLQGMLNIINQKEDEDNDGPSINVEDLEALLDNARDTIGNKAASSSKPTSNRALPPAPPKKTGADLKEEVLKLKAAMKMKEATEVFKVYKQRLIEESQEKEIAKCQEIIHHIQAEIGIAVEEQRLYDFYSRFVNAEMAKIQLEYWFKYQQQCEHIIRLIQTKKSSNIVTISRKTSTQMRVLEDDIVQFINKQSTLTDTRLQVSILQVCNMEENKPLQRVLHKKGKGSKNKGTTTTLGDDTALSKPSIRVHVNIHLPPNEIETDKSIDFTFEPSLSSDDVHVDDDKGTTTPIQKLQYKFDTTTGDDYVDLPRGDSKYAKSIIRRMERKRIQVSVLYVPPAPVKKSKGWFGRRSSASSNNSGGDDNADSTEPVLLGKVYLELKDLLAQNCIVGDYPLASGSGRPAGGTIRLGLRTGVPFVVEESTGMTSEEALMMDLASGATEAMPLYDAMSFTLT
eukprot:CAMPEP_0195303262 /NCGR_PEP_ID=MMETSP0707-20130614/32512_1 /TAXON_ID=33640 /ORGANISM="Asterionellopsis glacialis, Strain CCMP134" /LENGTH=809 /DNA_ID=CAMNT_0040366765 /DNA_START=87 /DNA_END=2519 /DNA_ORIENTATION=+